MPCGACILCAEMVSRSQRISLDVDRNLARGLHRVGVEVNVGFGGDVADLVDRLQHAGFVVRDHDADQLRVGPQRALDVVGIETSAWPSTGT